ncbi:IQ calmodulin-binding motif-containing protein [Sansalvadorimonas sp. 2012CJ34-2]|uniref:IQ calmodulin-binding motif-containing protein n=1 Tax=Parendozoicomonas callyspongiae TaxID=2942213 RepID=A0ABT0PDP2_9GAMM|nr:IQ calmodulin-binding motif-containing protein [Sansalvadorimonas sp. 2012CJ34-2]MCL6269455.1 IQ calmodulin-binding motif-containing protein [Sansalvadorimonas sp. 2012CJ34-2]
MNSLEPVTETSISTANCSQNEDKKSKAAVTIQKYWRGFKVWKDFKKTSIKKTFPDTGSNAIGNDPICFLEKLVTIKKHPAIVATGGAQCLSNAIRLTQRPDGSLGPIPKLFIFDYAKPMIDFWHLLSRAFHESQNIEQFLEKMPRHTDVDLETNALTLKLYYPPNLSCMEKKAKWLARYYSYESQQLNFEIYCPGLRLDDFHPFQHYEFFRDLFQNNPERFEWIKKLVNNQLCLIHHCWIKSPENFQFIKNVCKYHDYDIYVYTSNIEDACPGNHQALWKNITSLSPVSVVKTNTRFTGVNDQGLKNGYPVSTEYLFPASESPIPDISSLPGTPASRTIGFFPLQ